VNRLPFLNLAAKSLWNRRWTAGLTVFAIAVSVTLFLGVEKIRASAQASFDNTISGTDLIVGARSGSINLLLYSVFRIGEATNNITWQSYQEFAERPQVAWTIPISLGDSHKGYRVMGTDRNYFEHFRYGRAYPLELATGRPLDDVFDVVLGADVAGELNYRLGQEIIVSHGLGRTSFAQHKDKPFRIVGILKPTGTPVDRTVHVTLEGIEAVHVDWQSGAAAPAARRVSKEDVLQMDLQPAAITAFLVGVNRPIDVLRLQREINEYEEEPLLAILPGVTLRQLWGIVGAAETALTVIAGFVVFAGLLGMLTSILTSLRERRREMAILRSVGARPWHIFALLTSEAVMLALAGSVLGLMLVYGSLFGLGPWIESQFGVYLEMGLPGLYDAGMVLAVVGSALVLGTVPAALAYRQSLADGLTVRV